MLTLIGSLRSPFVRQIRIYLLNSKIEFKLHAINYLENADDAKFLAHISPINKIPILMDGDQKIFDSRVIFNYINQKHQLSQLTIAEENILTAIHTCIEVSVSLFLLQKGGEVNAANWYIQRQRERIPECLNFILPWVKSLNASHAKDWNYLSMALYSYLDWAQSRQLIQIEKFPEMLQFCESFKVCSGVKETDFRGL